MPDSSGKLRIRDRVSEVLGSNPCKNKILEYDM